MLLCAIADTKEGEFTDFVIQLPSTGCKFNRNVHFIGALQPNGSYWRLGANEATEITINQDFTIMAWH